MLCENAFPDSGKVLMGTSSHEFFFFSLIEFGDVDVLKNRMKFLSSWKVLVRISFEP